MTLRMTFVAWSVLASAAAGRADIAINWTNAPDAFDPAEQAVIRTAIECWERVIEDYGDAAQPAVLDVDISQTQTPQIGAAFNIVPGVSSLPASASIIIDNGAFANQIGGWFVDPTPTQNEEFLASGFDHYGGALAPSPAAGKIDLLSVVVHELGHALGFSESLSLWAAASNNSTGVLTYGPGQTIRLLGPSNFNSLSHLSHLDAPYDLMCSAGTFPGPDGAANRGGFGDRRVPSQLNLEILSGIYGYGVDFDGLHAPIPEPGMIGMFVLGGAMLMRRRG